MGLDLSLKLAVQTAEYLERAVLWQKENVTTVSTCIAFRSGLGMYNSPRKNVPCADRTGSIWRTVTKLFSESINYLRLRYRAIECITIHYTYLIIIALRMFYRGVMSIQDTPCIMSVAEVGQSILCKSYFKNYNFTTLTLLKFVV